MQFKPNTKREKKMKVLWNTAWSLPKVTKKVEFIISWMALLRLTQNRYISNLKNIVRVSLYWCCKMNGNNILPQAIQSKKIYLHKLNISYSFWRSHLTRRISVTFPYCGREFDMEQIFLRKLQFVVKYWNISIMLRKAVTITKKMTLAHKNWIV